MFYFTQKYPAKADEFSARCASVRLLLVFFMLLVTVEVKAGDFTYTTNSDNTLTITDYTGQGGAVVIPSAIEGRTVTVIGDWAFSAGFWTANTNLTSVTMPDSVTIIGNHAFESCSFLSNVMLSAGVTSIGDDAFELCTRLPSVTIPDSVTNIGDFAFNYCTSMTNVIIGKNVTGIGDYAFFDCENLASVNIPNNVTSIGNYAFNYCLRLVAITVDVANSIYSSVDGVLFNKPQTILITYPIGKTGNSYTIPDSVTNIGKGAFSRSTVVRETIPHGVTSIGDEAFSSCPSLIKVMIGNSVTNIGDMAFAYCTSLMGVYFTGNAPRIGSIVFDGDDLATLYYLPGTTGWGPTFGGQPAIQWWDGPQISANGIREDVSLNSGDALNISVAMNADNHVGFPVDWWVIVRAGSSWGYLNSSGQWTQFDGSSLNCHPVYQGGLFNLSATEVLNARGLQPGSYTFWFAIDYPMDGVLNLGGYILMDSVNVTVQ